MDLLKRRTESSSASTWRAYYNSKRQLYIQRI